MCRRCGVGGLVARKYADRLDGASGKSILECYIIVHLRILSLAEPVISSGCKVRISGSSAYELNDLTCAVNKECLGKVSLRAVKVVHYSILLNKRICIAVVLDEVPLSRV